MGTLRSNSESPQAGRFLSCQEAGRILDLSDDTIRRLIHSGKLDAVRVGRRCLRVTAESVRRYAEPVVIPTGVGGTRQAEPEARGIERGDA